ncbi:MAG: PAS domain S-box protein, partial [Candidatus Tectimicrobiota bacterium]
MGEFAGYRLDGTGHVHILNSRGLDLFESVGMPNRLHSPHKPGTYEDIRRLSVGHLVFKDARGEGFIAGFAPVVPPERLGPATFGGQQLYVLVEQNLEEAYASIYDLVKILLGLGTFVLVAIYMTARLTAKTITDPLDELRRGTQVVRDGDLAHRVGLATGDELQELADSFNEMTARLQASYEVMEYRVRERTAELEQAVHALEGEITEREQAQKALGETRAFYERLVGEAGDAVVALDWNSALVTWNLGAEKIFGYKAHEVLGKHSGFMVPEEDLERAKAIRQAVLAGQTVRDEVVRRVGKDGVIIDGLATFSPLRNSEGQVVGLCTIFKDITERRRASEELERFALQQTAVAELGSLALRSGELQVLMDEAVRLAAEALGVEMCEILKLEDSGETLRLMAGVGWREGLVGWATVGTELESQAGYTLREGGPVIVEDLRSESRFSGPSLLRDHEVVSGLSVPMVAGDFVFGVMGVHSTRRQDFSEEDVRFLEVMANVVTTAILAKQAEEALRQAHA